MKAKLFTVSVAVLLSACTEPGELTGYGAAGGAAAGAGLGAIIGSTNGNAGSGLVVGAALGAATGGLVANSFEAQQKLIEEQELAVRRSQEQLRLNRQQIEDLRRIQRGDEGVRARYSPSDLSAASQTSPAVRTPVSSDSANRTSVENVLPPRIEEKTITEPSSSVTSESSGNVETPQKLTDSSQRKQPLEIDNAECKKAADEVAQAMAANDLADQLFRYRRALRWCPQHPEYHRKLGDVYQKLGRVQDAQYEMKEASRLETQGVSSRKQNSSSERY